MSSDINRHDEAVCAICARSAIGVGFKVPGPRAGGIMWVCDDPTCLYAIKRTYPMPQREFTRVESRAAQAGGDEAGAYLDSIDQTDLAQMTPDQWAEFCRRLIAGYRAALSEALGDEATS